MNKTTLALTAAMTASLAMGSSIADPFNELGYGTIHGRLQSLSMTRDIGAGVDGGNSTLGGLINYVSPELAGINVGLEYVYANEIYESGFPVILGNPSISIFNEFYATYNFGIVELTNTTFTVGRKINNAEIFRADDIRQKSRSITAVQAATADIENWTIAGGHAWEQCSWNSDEFVDLYNEGITWVEAVFTGLDNLELALFDAVVWNEVNMIGARAKYNLSENTALLGHARSEEEIGSGAPFSGDTLGLSIEQKLGTVTLEGGYLGVFGDGLVLDQTSIGFNHVLGSAMLIRAGHWEGGANTYYLTAKTRLDKTKTLLYALGSYTANNRDLSVGDGYEVNVVIKQPIIENLSIALKGAIGEAERATKATDGRLFITYTF